MESTIYKMLQHWEEQDLKEVSFSAKYERLGETND